MTDKIICPHCRKLNEIHKFCVFCGKPLFSDEKQAELIMDNPEPYCLNCGRPVKKGQIKCECGYEFESIKCPWCDETNTHTNRFCTACGKKLWRSDVFDYQYDKRNFTTRTFISQELRHISLFKRSRSDVSAFSLNVNNLTSYDVEKLKSENLNANNALYEIRSRWRIISPHYCINCLSIIKPDEYSCLKCGFDFFKDKTRVEYIQNTENNYTEPVFDFTDLKLSIKYDDNYFNSLAPSIGESQLEYRERLKWEYSENIFYKNQIKNAISILLTPKPDYKPPKYSYNRYVDDWDYFGVSVEEWMEMHNKD